MLRNKEEQSKNNNIKISGNFFNSQNKYKLKKSKFYHFP